MFKSKKLLSALAVTALLSGASIGGAQAYDYSALLADFNNPDYNGNPGTNVYSNGYGYEPEYESYGYDPSYGNYGNSDPYNTSNYSSTYGGMYANPNSSGGFDVYDPTTGTLGSMSQSELLGNLGGLGGIGGIGNLGQLGDPDYSSYWNDANPAPVNTDYFTAYSNATGNSGSGSSSYLSSAAGDLWDSHGASGQEAITGQATDALSNYLGDNSDLGGLLGGSKSNLSFGVASNREVTDTSASMFPSMSFLSSVSAFGGVGGMESLGGFYKSFSESDYAKEMGIDDVLGSASEQLGEVASDGMKSIMGSLEGMDLGDIDTFDWDTFSWEEFKFSEMDLGDLNFANWDMGAITGSLGDAWDSMDIAGMGIGDYSLGDIDFSSITDSLSGITDSIGSFFSDFDMGGMMDTVSSFFG